MSAPTPRPNLAAERAAQGLPAGISDPKPLHLVAALVVLAHKRPVAA